MPDLELLAKFMKDFWELMKKFIPPQQTDAYWHSLLDAAGALGKKYDDNRLVQLLLLAYLDWAEGRTRAR